MKRITRDLFIVFLCFSVIFAGCAYFSPAAKQSRAEAKVEATKAKIDVKYDETIDVAKGFVYATDYSLKLSPDTNKYTEIAREMSSRAIETLAPIDKVDILKMRAIVDGLASTNKQIIARAQSMLQEKDNEIVILQNQISKYEKTLKENESKFIEVSRENSYLANKWVALKRIFYWIIYGFIFFVICKFLSVLLPPPYNSVFGIFDYLIGGIIRLIFKAAPKAMETAKVVSNKTETALQHVITSVQDIKEQTRAAKQSSIELDRLNTELSKNTDEETKVLITEMKRKLGYI